MSAPPRHVTLRDVAEAAGTSKATVSRALHRDPRISEATRKRVQSAAKSLGYRPDPALSALAAYRNRTRPPADHGKLAIVSPYAENDIIPYFPQLLSGIRRRAGELGYQTELFHLSREPGSQERLSRALFARGIQGVLVAVLPEDFGPLQMTWKFFTSASVGKSLVQPLLHDASYDFAGSVNFLYLKLRALGYRKIGYYHSMPVEMRSQYLYLSSYLKCLFLDGQSLDNSPPFFGDGTTSGDPVAWIRRHGFDAVLCGGDQADLLEKRIKETGLRIPRDIGLAVIALAWHDHARSGLREDMPTLGESAMTLLHSMLLNGERGIPKQRHLVLIDGIWQKGGTVRKQTGGRG
jgi:LacI family transcriptional regulator